MLIPVYILRSAAIIHQAPVGDAVPGNAAIGGLLNIESPDKYIVGIVRIDGNVEGMPCEISEIRLVVVVRG